MIQIADADLSVRFLPQTPVSRPVEPVSRTSPALLKGPYERQYTM